MANVSLGEKFERYLNDKVKSGDYASVSEVIRDALRLKMQAETVESAKLEALRRDVDIAWEQADAGEFIDYDINDFLDESNAR